MLRASGVPYDIRRADPYSIYDRFDFNVVSRTEGDMYARYLIRIEEMRESLKILGQALKQIPAGPILPGNRSTRSRSRRVRRMDALKPRKANLATMLSRTASPIHIAITCALHPSSI